jgi:hypothetical protein
MLFSNGKELKIMNIICCPQVMDSEGSGARVVNRERDRGVVIVPIQLTVLVMSTCLFSLDLIN